MVDRLSEAARRKAKSGRLETLRKRQAWSYAKLGKMGGDASAQAAHKWCHGGEVDDWRLKLIAEAASESYLALRDGEPMPQAYDGRRALETTQEIDGVELTKAAIDVARAFMDLPRNRRDEIQRQLVAEALQHSSRVPDEQLGHLAAPGPKKRVKGTQ